MGERRLKKELQEHLEKGAGTRLGRILTFQVRKYGFGPQSSGEFQLEDPKELVVF